MWTPLQHVRITTCSGLRSSGQGRIPHSTGQGADPHVRWSHGIRETTALGLWGGSTTQRITAKDESTGVAGTYQRQGFASDPRMVTLWPGMGLTSGGAGASGLLDPALLARLHHTNIWLSSDGEHYVEGILRHSSNRHKQTPRPPEKKESFLRFTTDTLASSSLHCFSGSRTH